MSVARSSPHDALALDPASVRDVVRTYVNARPRSQAMIQDAARVLPGAETRSVTHYDPFPTVIISGQGAAVRDLDGIEYIDLVNNYTSLVHGNAFPPATDAIRSVLASGTVFPSAHPSQVELGEALIERIPSVERVRFTNSGSEASVLALRLARFATGRRAVVLAEGAYHGALLPFTSNEPDVTRVPFNDPDVLESAVTEEVAAVFMEPFLGAGGVIAADAKYLQAVARRCAEVGAIFVLDEIQSLRNSYSGVGHEMGLTPDLTLMAKVIGGGLPVGAIGGNADLIDLMSPSRAVRLDHAGTFNGSIAAMVGGLAAVNHLDEAAIVTLNGRGLWLQNAIAERAAAVGFACVVTRAGSILNVHPGSEPVKSAKDAGRDQEIRRALHLALMNEGIYTTPRGMINLSTTMTDSQVAGVANAFGRSMSAIASR